MTGARKGRGMGPISMPFAPRTPSLPSRSSFRRALLLSACGGVLVVFAIARWAGKAPLSHALSLLGDLLMGSACFSAFRRSRGEAQEARGWRIFGLACLLITVTGALRSLSEIGILHLPWISRPLALVFVCNTGLIGLTLLSWPLAPHSGAERRRKALEGFLFAAAFFFIAWSLILGPVFHASALPVAARSSILLYTLAYGVLLGIAAYLGAQAPERFLGPLGWVCGGMLVACLGNLAWAWLMLRGSWYDTHPLNFTSFLIPYCYLMAAWSPRPVGRLLSDSERTRHPLLALALPYLPPLAALGVGAGLLLREPEGMDRVSAGIALTLLLLLVLRQGLAVLDLHRLSTSLERRVQERTKALEESQSVLMRTQRMNVLATLGAGLAHDFKNLLNVIRGLAAVVQTDVQEGRAADGEDLSTIQSAATQAAEMASHLLALGSPEERERRVFDLGEQVLAFQPILSRLAPREVHVLLELEPVQLPLRGDPLQIEQILVNLVSNARDAMPLGGAITIRTRLELAPRGPMAGLEVEDDGTGMEAEVLARIFDPFFSTKAPGRGTGLGLASVKAIVERQGGALQARSTPGRGTVFSLSFPLADPDIGAA